MKFTKQTVIYNFINLPKRKLKKNRSKLNIGFVGRLEKEKGFEKFLEITNQINDKKFNFLVFGDGSLKKLLKNNKKIKFFSWSKRRYIYKKINILFVTSEIENCPFNVLEAKSFGIPTVTIAKGGIKEIISNNKDGIIIDENRSIKQTKKAFIDIYKNYKFFENNCLKNSKKFYLKNYKQKLLNLI